MEEVIVSYQSKIIIGSLLFGIFLIFDISWSTNIIAIYENTVSLSTLKGYVDGVVILYIVTDTSDNKTATSLTESQGHTINFAPLLASVPNRYLQQGYDFLNGIRGELPFGFQLPVGSAVPGDSDYSPLIHLYFVNWTDASKAKILKSTQEIVQAQQNGEV